MGLIKIIKESPITYVDIGKVLGITAEFVYRFCNKERSIPKKHIIPMVDYVTERLNNERKHINNLIRRLNAYKEKHGLK